MHFKHLASFGGKSHGRSDLQREKNNNNKAESFFRFKVARCSFSGPIPPKFELKVRRHKQSFGKIANTVVLDEDENLL